MGVLRRGGRMKAAGAGRRKPILYACPTSVGLGSGCAGYSLFTEAGDSVRIWLLPPAQDKREPEAEREDQYEPPQVAQLAAGDFHKREHARKQQAQQHERDQCADQGDAAEARVHRRGAGSVVALLAGRLTGRRMLAP